MTEHDQGGCPRCGRPAGDSGFCPDCRAHIESLTGIPIRAGMHVCDPSAADVLGEVQRLEQVLAATSRGIKDRIAAGAAATAVPVDAEAYPAEIVEVSDPAVEAPKLAASADHFQARREVARLEDVLIVAPTRHNPQPPTNGPGGAVPEVEPRNESEVEPAQRLPEVSPTPVAEVELPAGADEHVGDPGDAASHETHQAFWFERASVAPPMPVVDPDRTAAASPTSDTKADPGQADAQPAAEHNVAPSDPTGQGWRKPLVTAVCLLVLVGLVALLTGRDPRRLVGRTTS